MAAVLGTSEAARLIHTGSASTGQAKPERNTSGSEVKRTTCMAVSRLVKKARTAKPEKDRCEEKWHGQQGHGSERSGNVVAVIAGYEDEVEGGVRGVKQQIRNGAAGDLEHRVAPPLSGRRVLCRPFATRASDHPHADEQRLLENEHQHGRHDVCARSRT